MDQINITLNVGAKKPFQLMHLSDTHLTRADIRDGQRKVTLAEKRLPAFKEAEEVLEKALKMAKELNVTIIHTGDLIDFVSKANLEAVAEVTTKHDIFMAAGNHEFSLYVGEAKEDEAYRNQSLDAVQAVFNNDIRMSSRLIEGVNFVALDNGYYLFEEKQLQFLKKEAEKGFPVVLLMHTPLYEQKLYEISMQNTPCAYLAGVPEELMRGYPEDRYIQQLADEPTKKMIEYIHNEPLIKAIIAGHLHFNYEGIVAGRIPQVVTDCTDVRLIHFI